MFRLDRKNKINNEFRSAGKIGIFDLFDDSIKQIYRINDNEYDYIAENITDEESDLFLAEKLNFHEKRMLLLMLDKYLNEFYK
jgi:hypothetical protein